MNAMLEGGLSGRCSFWLMVTFQDYLLVCNAFDAEGTSPMCRDYLKGLLGYLESFYNRTQPLASLSKVYAKLADFEDRFEAGEVPGWSDKGALNVDGLSNGIDMTAFATVEEVEALGKLPHVIPLLGE